MITNPAATLAVANQGLARGLPRYEEMVDQSMAKEPIPRAWVPEPNWLTRTDFGLIQHSQEKLVVIMKR